MDVPDPEDRPQRCPVCETAYESVSAHRDGLMVNLRENDRYRRVCLEPVTGPRVRFYHHTHDQTTTDGSADGSA